MPRAVTAVAGISGTAVISNTFPLACSCQVTYFVSRAAAAINSFAQVC